MLRLVKTVTRWQIENILNNMYRGAWKNIKRVWFESTLPCGVRGAPCRRRHRCRCSRSPRRCSRCTRRRCRSWAARGGCRWRRPCPCAAARRRSPLTLPCWSSARGSCSPQTARACSPDGSSSWSGCTSSSAASGTRPTWPRRSKTTAAPSCACSRVCYNICCTGNGAWDRKVYIKIWKRICISIDSDRFKVEPGPTT